MSSSESGSAAGRIEAYLDARDVIIDDAERRPIRSLIEPHDGELTYHQLMAADLRAVLAENQEMREKAVKFRTALIAELPPADHVAERLAYRPCGGEQNWLELAEAIHRLVGTWQPADGQHDPNSPVTYPVVSNDTGRGLTC